MENNSNGAVSYWEAVRTCLADYVVRLDYAFLDGFGLSEKLRAAAVMIIRYASNMPVKNSALPNLSAYMTNSGFKPWCISRLRDKGFLDNPVLGQWQLNPKLFSELAKTHDFGPVPLVVTSRVSPKIKKEAPNKTQKKAELDGKLAKLYNYLINEVGPRGQLIFTYEAAIEKAKEMGTSISYVYAMLQSLQNKSLLRREKKERGEGILLTFYSTKETDGSAVEKPVEHKKAKNITASGLIKRSEGTIENLKAQIASKESEILKLRSQINAEVIFLSELKKRS